MNLFLFPGHARWSAEAHAVEFAIGIGEYRGMVRVPRRVFQQLLEPGLTPRHCLEAFHRHRSRFERAAENKLRARKLMLDGNLELSASDIKSAL